MCENEKKIQELNDDDLDQIAGGASDEVNLNEHRLPGGWHVTCCNCSTVFAAGNGACPKCGSKYVYMRY